MAELPVEICEFIWAGTAASAGRVRSATLPCFLEIYTGAQFQAAWARPCKLLLVRVDLRHVTAGASASATGLFWVSAPCEPHGDLGGGGCDYY